MSEHCDCDNKKCKKSGNGKFVVGAALGAIAGAVAGHMISKKMRAEEAANIARLADGEADDKVDADAPAKQAKKTEKDDGAKA